MSGGIPAIVGVAQLVCRVLPKGLREAGVGRILKKELEIAGFRVEREQPVIVMYRASDGTHMCAQTGFIDFVVNGSNTERYGVELKVARSLSVAHLSQAEGYAAALNIPVVAVAICNGECETMVLNG